jgi:hypothetical protein
MTRWPLLLIGSSIAVTLFSCLTPKPLLREASSIVTPKIDSVQKSDTTPVLPEKSAVVEPAPFSPAPQTIEIESWPGERFALLEKPAMYCNYGYELYSCPKLDSCRDRIDTALLTKYHRVKCSAGSKLRLTVTAVEPRPGGEWLVTFTNEPTGTKLYAVTSKGVAHEVARVSDLDSAQKRWIGKTVFAARGFISTFQSGKTGSVKVRLQDSLKVTGVRFGLTPLPTKPIWVEVATVSGEKGVIPVYYSWTNVKKEARRDGNPWDDDLFETNPALTCTADPATWETINGHHVHPGMTRDQVRLSWGFPIKRFSELYGGKERECWEYAGQRLYFDEKELVGIVDIAASGR